MPTKWANGQRRSRNSYATPSGAPLSNKQKAALAQLAREAYDLQVTDLSLDDWRHAEQLAAVGKASLRDCDQSEFLKLKSHFLELAGEEGDALRAENDAEDETTRVARFKLREALTAGGKPKEYAEKIARDRWKRPVSQLNAKQVWQLVYTVNKRR